MQHQVMGYDRAATMFAPDGHILQVEYAEKSIRLGSASIGMICKDGVFILSDRRHRDKLVLSESANKIYEIDEPIFAVSAGIVSDARVLIDKARILAQQHRVTYDSPIATESIVKEISDIKQQFTQYGGARPFGVALMIMGFGSRPELFTTDVSGNYLQYKANAIGEDDEKIKEKLREKYKGDLNCDEGVKLALEIFKEVQKENYDKERFDLVVLKKDRKVEKRTGGKI